jgi:NAD(P)-dependent dehydrogenase (short-subunit alcohol dehydrogenase family)
MPAVLTLDGKHALVTGASSGLGQHFAGFLAAAGAKVTLAARREAALAENVEALHRSGHAVQSVPMDLTEPASIERRWNGRNPGSARSRC